MQSSSYLVQVDHVSSATDEATISYSSLTTSEKATFDRVKDGGSAPIKGTVVSTFANNPVQYHDTVYLFEIVYDPSTVSVIQFCLGVIVATVGGAVFLLTRFIVGRTTRVPSISA